MSSSDKLPFPPPRAPDEPSDLRLDRLAAGELEGDERAAVEAAIHRSAATDARYQAIARGFADPDLEARLFARIEAGLDEDAVAAEAKAVMGLPQRPSVLRRALAWMALHRRAAQGLLVGAGVAAVVLLMARPPGPPAETGEPGVRLKGGVGLTVHRQVAGGSEVVLSGATLPAGATLRFTVDVPTAGYLMVVDLDANASLAVAHPQDGSGAAVPIAAGRGQALGSAVALDDSVGDESLHAILCEAPFTVHEIRPGPSGRLALPDRCTAAPFFFHKRR